MLKKYPRGKNSVSRTGESIVQQKALPLTHSPPLSGYTSASKLPRGAQRQHHHWRLAGKKDNMFVGTASDVEARVHLFKSLYHNLAKLQWGPELKIV